MAKGETSLTASAKLRSTSTDVEGEELICKYNKKVNDEGNDKKKEEKTKKKKEKEEGEEDEEEDEEEEEEEEKKRNRTTTTRCAGPFNHGLECLINSISRALKFEIGS